MADWELALAAVPVAYQAVAIIACLAFLRRAKPQCDHWPALSILKPSPTGELPPRAAIESHESQEYPEHQLVMSRAAGVATPNRKVGKLMVLAQSARHDVWIVNDGDIVVPPGYFKDVAATLEQPGVGLATCLFRARGDSAASQFEALGVMTDFMPGALVARLVGIREFGLGATLAFRKRDLDRIGGFAAIADFIADDYQLAKKITGLGLRAEIAPAVVETSLHGGWREVCRHQVRWARTIRCSKPGAYVGVPVAQAGLWAVVCAVLCGNLAVVAALIAVRVLLAWVAGVKVLRSAVARRWFWLAPLWDLMAFGVWIAGWAGNTVEWQERILRLDRNGRIIS